jgi:hypothetical protein
MNDHYLIAHLERRETGMPRLILQNTIAILLTLLSFGIANQTLPAQLRTLQLEPSERDRRIVRATNLSPELLLIKSDSVVCKGCNRFGVTVFQVKDNKTLNDVLENQGLSYKVNAAETEIRTSYRQIIVSYGDVKPTDDELEEAGFKIVDDVPLGTFLVIQPKEEGELTAKNVTALSKLTAVKFAGLNHQFFRPKPERLDLKSEAVSAEAPNDSYWPYLWGMRQINAHKAWANGVRGSDIIVGVIDTGVDYRHDDLRNNMWTNQDGKHGYNSINGNYFPMDDNNHGTHCAGTIAAIGNDNYGVVGVNWQARIMALKFLSANGGGSEANAVKCIYYALANGARVLNNSWGTPYESEELEEAIRVAQGLGVLFIAAAGNSSSDNDLSSNFPSNYSHAKYKLDNVISVAAVDSDGKLASFSNYGKSTVDLAAPGAGILSTIRSSDWRSLSGTSMATPHVAGAAALIWSRDESKDWREIKKLLLDNVMKSPALEGKVASGGRLDIGFLASAPLITAMMTMTQLRKLLMPEASFTRMKWFIDLIQI